MRRLLSAMTLCVALAAQEAVAPFRFVPADSCLVVRAGAPARWKQHFAKTQAAKLMGAEALAPLVAQASAAIDAGMEQIRSSGKFDASLLQHLLADYTGELVFSLQVDFADVPAALAANRPPAMSMVCALTPGGGYDLAALATGLQTFIEAESEHRRPLKDLTVGDLRLRVTADEQMQGSLPFMHDGHLVMLFGSDLEKSAARLIGEAGRFEGAADGRPFSVYAKLDRLMAMFITAMAARMEEEGVPVDVAKVLRDIGLGSLESASFAIGADDKHVVSELRVSLGDGEPGLFGAVMLDQARPKLLRWVPVNSESFSVSALDLGAVFRSVGTIWGHLGESVPVTFEQAMTAVTEATKVRLQEELVAHLGTEILMVGDVDAQFDVAPQDLETNPAAMLQGSCICVALRNGKAFGESLEKILRSRGLHAGRKSEDYLDTKIHRMTLVGLLEIEYAVTDDLFLLAAGKDEAPRRNLRAVLDARAKPGQGDGLPPAIAAHVAAVPTGWSGISVSPVAQLLNGMSTMLEAMPGMNEVPGLAMALPVMKSLAGEMKRLGIDQMVSTSHTTARSYVQRVRW